SLSQQQLLLSEIETMIGKREERSKKAEDSVQVERKTTSAEGSRTTTFQGVEVDISGFYGRKLLIDHR
ncbi:MAG: hypothetical protein IH612_20795, partial [Desulfofustis sp.]|nr:hypothetical protein [Desulfofustis sp.]